MRSGSDAGMLAIKLPRNGQVANVCVEGKFVMLFDQEHSSREFHTDSQGPSRDRQPAETMWYYSQQVALLEC